MLLVIDAGNTNIVFALYEGKTQRRVWRCWTDSKRTADEYAAWLFQLFTQDGLDFGQVSGAALCSVVPDADFHLDRLCRESFGCAPLVVSHETAGLEIKLADPASVGADRLANAAAVVLDGQTPAIVVDFGTATTFDVIDASGAYCGGAIAPGPNLSMRALHMAAAKLPGVDVKKPPSVIGTDTVSAMQSGIYWGYAGMIEGLLRRMSSEMGAEPFIIATGGLADLFGDEVEAIQKVDKDLTLRGILHIYTQAVRKSHAA